MTEASRLHDTELIKKSFREWGDLEVKGDLDAWLKFVADDAILHPAGEPEVHGKAAIREYAAKFFQLPIVLMEPGELTVFVSESSDLAYNVGSLKMVLDNPDGKVDLDMKCTAIWRKISGEWRIALNSWSSNRQ